MKFIESLVADRTPTRTFFRILTFVVMLPLLLVVGAFVFIWIAAGQVVTTLISLGEFAVTGDADFHWFRDWSD